jgi:microcin C transport system substrate-binding protein
MRVLMLAAALMLTIACNEKNREARNIFYQNLMSEPTTLNPITASDGYSRQVHSYILESLLDRDIETYEWKGALAKSWEISKDKKVYTFKLRENVIWHDGKPFTADDIKFSFDVIFDPEFNTAHKRPYYEGIDRVEVIDPLTVKFYTKTKFFLNFETAAGMAIYPKHLYTGDKKNKKLNRIVIGTGAYMLDKYDKGKKILLKRNPNWWGDKVEEYKGQNNFKKIGFRFVGDKTVALEMLKKGNVDFKGLDSEEFMKKAVGEGWGDKYKKVKTQNKTPTGYSFYGWNLSNPLFKDVRVRKALAHLVNRPLMLDKFEYGMSDYANGPIYVSSDYNNPKVKPLNYDPNKALKYLKEAGWKDTDGDLILDKQINGKKVDFKFTIIDPYEGFMKYNTIFKEDCKKVGINAEIKIVEWNTFLKLLDEKNFEAVRLAWGGGGIDWTPKQIWHSSSAAKGGSNFIGYKNKTVDKLIEKARETFDKAKRVKLLQKVHKIIADDAPYAFFFNRKYILYAHRTRIEKEKDTYTYGVGTSFWKVKEAKKE